MKIAHWASGHGNLFAPQENLLAPEYIRHDFCRALTYYLSYLDNSGSEAIGQIQEIKSID